MFKSLSRIQSLKKDFNEKYHLERFSNVFNPSLVFIDKMTIFSFRYLSRRDSTKFDSHIIFDDAQQFTEFNLSEYIEKFDISPCSDPKLVRINDEIFCTFNDGYKRNGNNLYLMKIYPHFEKPKRCSCDKKQLVEKNWVFFSKNGELHSIYSLFPFIIINREREDENSIYFRTIYKQDLPEMKNFTIGTQLLNTDEKYYLIAHKKITFPNKKRMYLGKMIRIVIGNEMNNQNVKLFLGKHYLVHNFKSIFGSKKKYNPNLLSCSYFSGLTKLNDDFIISYGVNDLDFNICSFKESDKHEIY